VAEEILRLEASSSPEIVFVAPEEYQVSAGLNFYTQGPIKLLSPDGARPRAGRFSLERTRPGFVAWRDFLSLWRGDKTVFLVTTHDGGPNLQPRHVLGKWGDRLLLSNRPLADPGRGQDPSRKGSPRRSA
jgi:hypothetical protein